MQYDAIFPNARLDDLVMGPGANIDVARSHPQRHLGHHTFVHETPRVTYRAPVGEFGDL